MSKSLESLLRISFGKSPDGTPFTERRYLLFAVKISYLQYVGMAFFVIHP
ncbi:MAG: hypothetical protein LBL24_11185 [Bacteroidales bacterium]|nr:hypothetical protein [Bacteroidales bacterium]